MYTSDAAELGMFYSDRYDSDYLCQSFSYTGL